MVQASMDGSNGNWSPLDNLSILWKEKKCKYTWFS